MSEHNAGLAQSSSKGTQHKYHKGDSWYKEDKHNESLAECVCCRYLKLLQFTYPLKIIDYVPRISKGSRGCLSADFGGLGKVRTFYRLIQKTHTKQYYRQFDDDPQRAYKVLLEELKGYNANVGFYITELFMIDTLIRNSDRHTNNMALIETKNGYIFAPIFDNGEALFVDKSRQLSAIDCLNKYTIAKPFGLTYDNQLRMAMQYYPVQAQLTSDVLDLSGVDWSIYDPAVFNRAVAVLQATTMQYLGVELRINL